MVRPLNGGVLRLPDRVTTDEEPRTLVVAAGETEGRPRLLAGELARGIGLIWTRDFEEPGEWTGAAECHDGVPACELTRGIDLT